MLAAFNFVARYLRGAAPPACGGVVSVSMNAISSPSPRRSAGSAALNERAARRSNAARKLDR